MVMFFLTRYSINNFEKALDLVGDFKPSSILASLRTEESIRWEQDFEHLQQTSKPWNGKVSSMNTPIGPPRYKSRTGTPEGQSPDSNHGRFRTPQGASPPGHPDEDPEPYLSTPSRSPAVSSPESSLRKPIDPKLLNRGRFRSRTPEKVEAAMGDQYQSGVRTPEEDINSNVVWHQQKKPNKKWVSKQEEQQNNKRRPFNS